MPNNLLTVKNLRAQLFLPLNKSKTAALFHSSLKLTKNTWFVIVWERIKQMENDTILGQEGTTVVF